MLIKYIVTVVYMLHMVFFNAVVLYLPGMATSGALGIDRIYSILILGIVCVFYSGMGGVKAVIWSDLFQACSMFAGLFAVGALGTWDAGGFGEVWRLAGEQGRLNLDDFLNLDLTTRHTLFSILVGSTLKHVYMVGVNQVQIQRALSLPSLRQAQLAFVFCSLFGAALILLASYLGAVLVASYRSCDPYLAGQIPRRDAVLVHFVSNRLASIPGLRGFFVAGIYSGTLSTLSSFANSMAALAMEDFVKPARVLLGQQELSDRANTWLSKFFAIFFGSSCVLMAYTIEHASSRMLQITTTLYNAIGVPFVIAFGFGILTRFVNTAGILAGFAATLSLGGYISIYQSFFKPPLKPTMPVFFANECLALFNATMVPAQEGQLYLQFLHQANTEHYALVEPPFSLDRISYMTLPVVQLVIMMLVTPTVSLLTGGCKQEVDDQHLLIWTTSKQLQETGGPTAGKSGSGLEGIFSNSQLGAWTFKSTDEEAEGPRVATIGVRNNGSFKSDRTC